MVKNLLSSILLLASAASSAASDNLELGIPGTADQIINREGHALGYSRSWKQARGLRRYGRRCGGCDRIGVLPQTQQCDSIEDLLRPEGVDLVQVAEVAQPHISSGIAWNTTRAKRGLYHGAKPRPCATNGLKPAIGSIPIR